MGSPACSCPDFTSSEVTHSLQDLTMDSIRKKMQSLKYETDELIRSIHDNEEVAREANDRSDRCDCDIRDYGKKITKMESDFEETAEKLQKATADLEEKKKQLQELEADLSAISRRVLLLEDELNKSEIKLAKATMDLAVESKRADKVVKVVNTLTSKAMNDEVEIENLSKQERESKIILCDSQKKYEEMFRRLGVMEEELKRAEDRANTCQKKLENIDEELKLVGENMKQLEVAEEKALAREEKYKEQIVCLTDRMKEADVRAEFGEMNITKLNQRIDNIEDDIIREKMKGQRVSKEMSDTFVDMIHKY